MARRRGRRFAGRKRTPTNWQAGALSLTHVAVAAATPTNLVLFAPLVTSTSPITVLRIVGALHSFLQAAAPAAGGVVQWLIYKSPQGFRLDPGLVSGQDSDMVMFQRSDYFVNGAVIVDSVDFEVDIKVARRLIPPEDDLVLTVTSTLAFFFAANLRVLLKEP